MSEPIVEFAVYGQPATQGSKRAVVRGGQPFVINDNPKLTQWRQQVAEKAREVYQGEPVMGAVKLVATFRRPRPKSHYGTGRNAERLKESAPLYPTGKPDTLKLARAIEDALTGVVWRDDAQIVLHDLTKLYGNAHYIEVSVWPLEPERKGKR